MHLRISRLLREQLRLRSIVDLVSLSRRLVRVPQGLRGPGQAVVHPGCIPLLVLVWSGLPDLLSLCPCGGYDELGFIASDGLLPSFRCWAESWSVVFLRCWYGRGGLTDFLAFRFLRRVAVVGFVRAVVERIHSISDNYTH